MANTSTVPLNIGDIVLATITKVTKTHVEMSLGDVCAIMPASEYSWHRSHSIRSDLKVSDKIQSVVIAMKNGIVMLSVKRMKPDPWMSVEERYKIGMKVKGLVKRILPFGAFIELDEDIQGLLHRKEISKSSDVDIKTIFSEAQEVEVNIISIEKEERKISFSVINNV